jgi:hypothetical protein
LDAFKKKLIVPPDRIQAGLRTSLAARRDATLAHVALPASARWKAFIDLLSSPPVISDLAKGTTLDPDR